MSDETFQPLDLSPELQKQSEIRDLEIQKSLDGSWGIFKEEVDSSNVLQAMTIRLIQYIGMFKTYSLEFLIIQAVQDFRLVVTPLQVHGKELRVNKPLAELDGRKIIVTSQNIFKFED